MQLFFCLCVIYSATIFAKERLPDSILTEQYIYCKQLHAEEKYFDAVTEAKRLIFFDSLKEYSFRANSLIADCYKQGGKFREALIFLGIASKYVSNEEEKITNKIESIRIHILNRSTSIALRQAEELKLAYTEREAESHYWKGWIYMFADRWGDAANMFALIDTCEYLKKFCEDIDNKKYSVTFAKAISYFLPGSGQVYSGEYINGILSLGWNIASGYLSVEAFKEERVFDGAAILSLLWLRFYSGNISNAEKFAKEKNSELYNSALNYLQLNFKGLKP